MNDVTPVNHQQPGGHGAVEKRGQIAIFPCIAIAQRERPGLLPERPDVIRAGDAPVGKDPIHVPKVLDPLAFGEQRDPGPVGAVSQPQEGNQQYDRQPREAPSGDAERTTDHSG